MALIVKKFGGSSVATTEKIMNIAKRVLGEKKPGDKIVFGDMGSYSFAQMNYFNGINYPDICFYSEKNGFQQIKSFDYMNYEALYD